jgi:hypothetical protein
LRGAMAGESESAWRAREREREREFGAPEMLSARSTVFPQRQ